MAKPKCFSCRDGENVVEADYYIRGVLDEKLIMGYICNDHYEMYIDDGMTVMHEEKVE